MKKILPIFILLSGCATQSPVDVVDGYGYKSRSVSAAKTHYAQPMKTNSGEEIYYVQPYDTLMQIASFYQVTQEDLRARNQLPEGGNLSAGMQLIIPTGDKKIKALNTPAVFTKKPTGDQKFGNYRLTQRREEATLQSLETQEIPVNDILSARPIDHKNVNKTPAQNVPQVIQHTIQAGENIFRVGLKYGVSQFDIIAANEGVVPEDLKIGQKIIIPVKGKTQPDPQIAAVLKPQKKLNNQKKQVQKDTQSVSTSASEKYAMLLKNTPKIAVPRKGFIWPVKGKLLKTFGLKERGVEHTGINIAAKLDTPIRASEGGKVLYSGNGLSQFGNLILIRHNGGFVTAYAHNAANVVKKNQWVKKGDVIGFVGNTGHVEVPQLHFEVRKNARAINPKKLLTRN